MKRSTCLLIIIHCMLVTAAQESPRIFEPGKISNGGDFGLTISPDSQTALWVRSNGGRDTLMIMQSIRDGDLWSKPVRASFSADLKWKDIDPMFSPDGKTVLFQSNRPVPGKPDRKGFDIWAVLKQKNGWSDPFHLGDLINTETSESFASVTSAGSIYFMKAHENAPGNSDIYVSAYKNGSYQTPVNIGLPVNTGFRESNPFISPNEDYLIYFSTDSSGFGEADLYITFREDGQWSSPQNLGNTINSSIAEFCPFYHEREKRLYFSRQIETNGRFKEELWFVPLDLEQFRKNTTVGSGR